MGTRTVFAGTPEFALTSLEALVSHPDIDVVAVYTQPDRPAGRGRKLVASPVKARALELDIPVLQPESLRSAEAVATLAALEPDLMVVTAYGLILPPPILSIPPLGCINVHGSLLPRWRGAAPIQRAIEAGDVLTGVCLMQMEAGLDSGPVYALGEVPISPEDTAGALHDKLTEAGGRLLAQNLSAIITGSLLPEPQDPAAVTYAAKLNRDEALIDWQADAGSIARRVRAFNPWPVARTTFRGEPLRVLLAAEDSNTDTDTEPGTVIAADADGVVVCCGSGSVRISRLQKAGGRAMSAGDFVNGTQLKAGERFG